MSNNGSSSDSLVGAATPVADKIQFHSVSEENGISRMHEMHSVELVPDARVVFSPGEMHVMLVGLKRPLKEGERVPMTLTFEKASMMDMTIPVVKVGAMQLAPTAHEHGNTRKR